jgi:iron(II)-dependent oxidoreductase
VADGGYEERRWWSPDGWAWRCATERRAPRHVEQMRGGVLVQRQGRLQRAPAGEPVLHATRHEAEAWCAWAGRRLPTEAEWEIAATRGAARGFAWGDAWEWVLGGARMHPGHRPTPDGLDAVPTDLPRHAAPGVLRGASWVTRRRWAHPKSRRFLSPLNDIAFAGFRSCAP